MSISKIVEKPVLGSKKLALVSSKKVNEIIDAVNAINDGTSEFDIISELTAAAGVTVDGTLLKDGGITTTASSTADIAGLLLLSGTPQTLTGAGAVNLTTKVTLLVTTGANALTLAAGTDGQVKIIKHKTDGGDGTLTVTGASGFSTITFSAVGQTATLLYKDSSWNVISVFGAVVA